MTDQFAPDYEVGYKKPPQQHQFKKGHSGNPRGRPKGSINLLARFRAVFRQEITVVTPDGKRVTMTKAEAALTRLMNEALAGGNTAATERLFKIMRQWGLEREEEVKSLTFVIEG